MSNKYTVICLYPDYAADDWPYSFFGAWVSADGPVEATRLALAAAADATLNEIPAEDFYPLAIISGGHHEITSGDALYLPGAKLP